jgi:hypothetical protein
VRFVIACGFRHGFVYCRSLILCRIGVGHSWRVVLRRGWPFTRGGRGGVEGGVFGKGASIFGLLLLKRYRVLLRDRM